MGKIDEIAQTNEHISLRFLQHAVKSMHGVDPAEYERLLLLAEEEIRPSVEQNPSLSAFGETLETLWKLGRIAKAVRLSGEYPHFIAKAIALRFASEQGQVCEFIRAKGIKAAVCEYCGLELERELIAMVAENFGRLPALGVDPKDDEKVVLMKKAYRQGYYYEKAFRGCAQCCMAAVSDVTGKDNAEMFRAANGLAAGMGLLGDGACGGYSGGLLSMGLFAGRRREHFDGDKEEKDLCTRLAGLLHTRFLDTYGSVICHDIHRRIFGQAFHITRPDDKAAFEAAGAHKLDKCPAVVGTGAAWVAEILYDEGMISGSGKNPE